MLFPPRRIALRAVLWLLCSHQILEQFVKPWGLSESLTHKNMENEGPGYRAELKAENPFQIILEPALCAGSDLLR